jgi:hypothetical protein
LAEGDYAVRRAPEKTQCYFADTSGSHRKGKRIKSRQEVAVLLKYEHFLAMQEKILKSEGQYLYCYFPALFLGHALERALPADLSAFAPNCGRVCG